MFSIDAFKKKLRSSISWSHKYRPHWYREPAALNGHMNEQWMRAWHKNPKVKIRVNWVVLNFLKKAFQEKSF